jgi:curli production assembly/transport component CsgG|tara:strand:+ start:5696 stop:6625 length:930 start_codon:yes stop_codon:yes gene_type:complete
MKWFLILTLSVLSGCASFPQWSENPQDCSRWDEGFSKDLVTGVKKQLSRKYICVEYPTVVRLPAYIELLNLPPAKEKPIVAVYQFQDLTGQRKQLDQYASFSTAVTQGANAMLVDALKTAGGGTWFRVVERTGLDHLVRERQIIRSARQEWAEAKGEESNGIAPLLFAGMIIEGGIIGYDTNLKTGGRGARTLGIGFSKQYRQDAVTVSIRAVSVLTGEVLLNVQSRKTILSYGSGGDVFRFIEEGTQLVEIEDGVGNNESVTYATRSAIEAGVLELIYQGHDRGFWVIEGDHRHPHNSDGKNDKHDLE